MYLPAVALIGSQRGLITYRQLLESGLTSLDVRRLLKDDVLVRVRHGVYADCEVWQNLDRHRGQPILRVRAAQLTLRAPRYVFSHDSASLLLDMGAPDPARSLVHVTRAKVHGDLVRGGVKHHRAPYTPLDVVEIDDLRVLDPARTALDMAREHGRVAGLAACDAALRQGVTRADLARGLERMRCWPRSRTMRWCIEMADAGAESYLESQGRDLVLEVGIGRPETQFGLSDGTRTVWCDTRVGRHVFEIDGMLKYAEGNPAGKIPDLVLREEKSRQDFITGFKLGISRITAYDCGSGRPAALRRLALEYADTCARFGSSIADLAPYIVTRARRPPAG